MVVTKTGLSELSPNYFQGQAWPDLWPGMANVCYCHKLNNMLNMCFMCDKDGKNYMHWAV